MRDDQKIFFVIGVIAAAIVILVCYAFKSDQADEAKWEQFKVENHCRVTGHTESTSGYGLAGGKMVFITTPARDTFTCDNGFTETRDAE